MHLLIAGVCASPHAIVLYDAGEYGRALSISVVCGYLTLYGEHD